MDVFSGLKLEYYGPSGKASVEPWVFDKSISKFDFVFDFSKSNNLSNGDEITVYITNINDLERRYHITPKETSRTYTVSGLPEIETLDIFSLIDVCFEGISGEAIVEINKLEDALKYINCVYF